MEVETESSGFDFRGEIDITPNLFGRASYLSTESDEFEVNGQDFDDVELELDILRLGFGYQGGSGTVRFFGALEYASAELDSDSDDDADEKGFVLSGGIKDKGDGKFLWAVELGLVQLEDTDGAVFEFLVGYRFNPTIAIILGGQGYGIEDDIDVEYSLSHGTLGVRLSF
ncbi:MAG: outer membrane beta-barrel protein [Panacagrimonas sp.]